MKKSKGGRPPYAPTPKEREQVIALTAMGATEFEISLVLQLSEPTVRKHFQTELMTGRITANARVAESLFRQATHATKPNVTAAIFWLKARAGWSDGNERGVREEPPGKKAIAREEAKTAAVGTAWDGLLPGGNSTRVQ